MEKELKEAVNEAEKVVALFTIHGSEQFVFAQSANKNPARLTAHHLELLVRAAKKSYEKTELQERRTWPFGFGVCPADISQNEDHQ